jgi:electron-transferring-flavoprotein dehydrogenase
VAILGDAGSLVNVPEMKGIDYAIESGILAAETIVEQLRAGSTDLSAYDQRVRESRIARDLFRTRNMKQPFGRGFFVGGALVNLMVATRGRFPGGHWKTHRDADVQMFVGDAGTRYPRPDNQYFFDKLSSVYLSGTSVRDDAPNHIRIQKRVPRVIAEAWASMCPAGVYEIAEGASADAEAEVDVVVNHTNCVQCGAIQAKGGLLTPPEGGDGPNYRLQ